MAVDVARLSVEVTADTRDAEAGLKRVEHGVQTLGERFKLSAVAGAGLGVGLLGVRAATAALSGGFNAVVGSGIALNTSMENVTAQLQAMTKDGGQAAKILADIRREADTTPFAFEEMARATAGLLPAAKQSGVALMDLVKQAEVLAATHPEQGLEGAAFALREALSGDFTSVIERFDLPRQRLNELKAQGVPAVKAIQQAMKEMGLDATLVSNLAQTMTGRWSTFQDTVAGIQGKLTAGLFDGLKSGLMSLQTLLDANKDKIDAVATAIGGAIGAFVSDAIPKLLDFGATVLPVVIGAFDRLRTIIGGVVGALVDLVRTGDVGVLADDLREAFGIDISGFVGPIRDMVAALGEVIAAVEQARERLITFFAALLDGQTLAASVNKAFGDLIPFELNARLDAVDAAVKNLKVTLADLANGEQNGGATGALTTLAAKLELAGSPRTAGALRTAIDDVTTALQNLTKIGDASGDMLTRLGQGLAANSGSTKTWGAVLDATMAAAVESLSKPLEGFNTLVAAVEALIPPMRAVETAYDEATAAIGAAIRAFVDAAVVKVGEWATAAADAFERARAAIAEKTGAALDAVERFADAVVAVLSGLVRSASAQASAVADGIVNGLRDTINGRVGEIAAAAAALVQAAIDAAKRAAGIRSPSTVFAEIGAQMVEGLAVGIQAAQKRGLDAMGDVVNGLRDIATQGLATYAAQLRDGLNAIPRAFDRATQLFRTSADAARRVLSELVEHFVDELARHNSRVRAGDLGNTIKDYFNEYLDQLATMGDAAVPAVEKVRQDLAAGLADAVADATASAQAAVEAAARSIQAAIDNLAESRDLRGRRSAFAEGQSAEARARQQAREDAEARYQLERDLARATTDAQKAQILARFADAEAERAHRRQLAEEDRLFAQSQADQRQAFEDALADEALAKQIARIGVERDARIAAVRDELAAREAGLAATARKALAKIAEDVNSAINASIGKVFDNLIEEMKKRGGPTDPGFLGAVRNEVAAIIVPIAGMLQTYLANLAGIPGPDGRSVPIPSALPGGAFVPPVNLPVAPPPAPVTIVVQASGLYGSVADMARVLKPELARITTT